MYGQEEGVFRVNPALMVSRESPGGNQAVYVRMQEQVLAPRMQNADETDVRSQLLGVRGHFQHGGRARAKEQIVDDSSVAPAEAVEFVWKREDYMKVRDVEEFLFTRIQPPLAGLRLALWTMPIATGVIRDRLVIAS